eukprot:1180638-Prorocentrum_minimum.AAC.2
MWMRRSPTSKPSPKKPQPPPPVAKESVAKEFKSDVPKSDGPPKVEVLGGITKPKVAALTPEIKAVKEMKKEQPKTSRYC